MARDAIAEHKRHKQERRVDDTVEDSFPASDPPSHANVTGSNVTGVRHERTPRGDEPGHGDTRNGRRSPSHARGQDARPSGQPTQDRHATDTAHDWEDGRKR